MRERRYKAAGKDCYLFNVNDEVVIDTTMRGVISRFTVRLNILLLKRLPHATYAAESTFLLS